MREIFAWTVNFTLEQRKTAASKSGCQLEMIPEEGILVSHRGEGVIMMLVSPSLQDALAMHSVALDAAQQLGIVTRLQKFIWSEDIQGVEGSDQCLRS